MRSNNRFGGSSRTPTFQPPSFYAAAAGLPYPSATDRSPSTNSPSHTSGMYPSMPLADGDSDSAREKMPTDSRPRRRSVSLSRSLLPGSHRQEKEKAKHERNKSQLVDIPFLETSLLPSLRDTIDKMTHPPRTVQTHEPLDPPSHGQGYTEFATPSGISSRVRGNTLHGDAHGDIGRSPVLSSSYASVSSPLASGPSKSAIYAPSGPLGLRTPQVTTPRTAYSTPKPNSNGASSPNPRSVLKSSHRTPQLLSPNSAAPTSPLPGTSLRSVKSLISPVQPNLTPNSSYHSPKFKSPGEGAESLKPGATVATPRAKYKAAPSTLSPSQQFSTSRSHIPVPNRIVDSGSELERQYGRTLASGKLVVANAVIEPSSSDSDAVSSRRQQAQPQSRLRTPKDLKAGLLEKTASPRSTSKYSPAKQPSPEPRARRVGFAKHPQTIGLGLDMYPNQRQSLHQVQEDDDRSIYEDEDDVAFIQDSRIQYLTEPRGHPVQYTDDEESVYEEDEDFYTSPHREYDNKIGNESDAIPQESNTSFQRQQALRGLVDGLRMDFGLHSERSRLSHSDSDGQHHVEGIAISGSADIMAEHYHDELSVGKSAASGELQTVRRRSRSRDRRDSTVEQRARFASPTTGSTKFSYVGATPSRGVGGRRDSRAGSTQPVSRSSPHQEPPTRERHPLQPGQETRTPSRSSAKSKSRHRVSMSVGQLTDKLKDSSDPQVAKVRRSSSQQRDSRCMPSPGEYMPTDNRSSDLILREREGFGIPASLSYGGIASSPDGSLNELAEHPIAAFTRSASENSVSSVESLCRVGSNLSTVEDDGWHNPAGGLSTGAQALFRNLSTGSQGARNSKRESCSRESTVTKPKSPKSPRRLSNSVPSRRSSSPIVSPMPNPWSPSHEQAKQPLAPLAPPEPTRQVDTASWKSTMRSSTYQGLLAKHGLLEMQRQELLYEQYLYQREFINRLRSIVRIFILPLRRKHSKSWLSGVPVQVARLFDWLEDIVNLHASIADTFETISQAWGSGIVIYVAQSLRGFIPRLEVYQPYLVRVDEVREMLAQHSGGSDEFTEFVKLRERHIECGGWTLADLLYQPVERLSDFVKVFQHLLDLTPSEHPDHLSTFSLYHSTKMIIHVLQEVKVREEEYQFVKEVAARMEGLLPSVQLAKRERRLLWHGEVVAASLESSPLKQESAVDDATPLCGPSQGRNRTEKDQTLEPQRHERKRDRERVRSGSLKSTTLPPLSRTNAGSSMFSPTTSAWNNHDLTPSIVLSPCPDVRGSEQDRRNRVLPGAVFQAKMQKQTFHCFVFTDVLMLAESNPHGNDREPHWRLHPGAGLSRILGLKDGEHLTLDLLLLSPSDLQTGVIPEGSSGSVTHISISPSVKAAQHDLLMAFRQCYAYTLRSLSFPAHNGHYLPHGPHVDLEHDTQQSVMAILNTGLPLPKSPSVQWNDMERLRSVSSNETDQEREERGWWTLRFQQVLKEMQRQDPSIPFELMTRTHPHISSSNEMYRSI